MKKIKIIVAFIGLILISSCEKVVDIDLNTMEPKLVIDAAIKWQKGTVGNIQTIKLSTTFRVKFAEDFLRLCVARASQQRRSYFTV